MNRETNAPGKIILSGEYAVLFGYPGIAVPSSQCVFATYEEQADATNLRIDWPQIKEDGTWQRYAQRVVSLCEETSGTLPGILHVHSDIPLGKGMGSSTAFVIATCRCLLGNDCEDEARAIEDVVNPGNSGIDFAVIWDNQPLRFQRGAASSTAMLDLDFLAHGTFIDTGNPHESTVELVSWIRSRSQEPAIADALKSIGACTNRLLGGEDPLAIFRDHHRAQVILGIVPSAVQELIAQIEAKGGAAKVIGAGGKTGGGGMVLALKP